jgi:hypothetical protein
LNGTTGKKCETFGTNKEFCSVEIPDWCFQRHNWRRCWTKEALVISNLKTRGPGSMIFETTKKGIEEHVKNTHISVSVEVGATWEGGLVIPRSMRNARIRARE